MEDSYRFRDDTPEEYVRQATEKRPYARMRRTVLL